MNIDFSQPRTLVYILIGLVIGIGLGYLFVTRPNAASQVGRRTIAGEIGDPENLETAPLAGALAPDFALESIDGRQVRLSEFRGRPVLINFWATWCGPCRIEMPAIQAKFEEHEPELVVLAVDFDEPAEDVRSFVAELDLTFEVLLDPGGEVNSNLYRVRGYPSSFFVDENGVIRVVQIGLMTEDQLAGYLEEVGLDG